MNTLWSFAEMEKHDGCRAAHLRAAPPWPELIQIISQALHTALANGEWRLGFDESSRDSRDLRVVVQFAAGKDIFDWFFNSHTGYRAQFRLGPENGLIQNARLISELVAAVNRSTTKRFTARRLSCDFKDIGPITTSVDQITESLDPDLSKVWPCEAQISNTGGTQNLFVSRSGPELTFSACESWRSFYPENADGWLDVKGAFVGPGGRYQLKPPEERAANLRARGSA